MFSCELCLMSCVMVYVMFCVFVCEVFSVFVYLACDLSCDDVWCASLCVFVVFVCFFVCVACDVVCIVVVGWVVFVFVRNVVYVCFGLWLFV